jgi:hypothetical protein
MADDNQDGAAGGGIPEAPAGPPPTSGGTDVKISNTGQRVRAILVVLIVIAIAAVVLWLYHSKQQEVERYEKLRADFSEVHNTGYSAFWKESQVDIKEMKTNQDFEARLKEILGATAVAYSKHMQENALPILAKALPKYAEITAPNEVADKAAAKTYADLVKDVSDAAAGLHEAWNGFADEVAKYETFLEARKKLDKAGNSWLGAQGDPENEKFKKPAIQYVALVKCILADKGVVFEIEPQALSGKLEETCDVELPAWWRRVTDECMPKLLDKTLQADAVYTQTLEVYGKAELPDTKSVFGIKACIDRARDGFESEIIENIAKAWATYVKAQNSLLSAVDTKLDELR